MSMTLHCGYENCRFSNVISLTGENFVDGRDRVYCRKCLRLSVPWRVAGNPPLVAPSGRVDQHDMEKDIAAEGQRAAAWYAKLREPGYYNEKGERCTDVVSGRDMALHVASLNDMADRLDAVVKAWTEFASTAEQVNENYTVVGARKFADMRNAILAAKQVKR